MKKMYNTNNTYGHYKIVTVINRGKSISYYYNKNGQLHREDGPAIESKEVSQYFLNGVEMDKNSFFETENKKK